MACEFEIVILDSRDRGTLVDIANVALEEIERLGVELSCFNPTSEVSFLNAFAAEREITVSPDLCEILTVAKEVWRETSGAFDITAGPLIELWRESERTGTPPGRRVIEDALARVGMLRILVNDENGVRVEVCPEFAERSNCQAGLQINLGAIGKGYAVAKAASILRDYDVKSALVSGGGSSVYGYGGGLDGDGWLLGIRHPSKFDQRVMELTLRDQAMATSGGPAQRDERVEEHFEHIIDPVTGAPAASEAASVTVITGDATRADALATAFYLRGRGLAHEYCSTHPNTRAIFVDIDGRAFDEDGP